MSKKRIVSFILAVAVLLSAAPAAFAAPSGGIGAAALLGTSIVSPTVNYQTNPLAIDGEKVRFGWQMDSKVIGVSQEAYRIVVLAPDGSAFWDSGIVDGDKSTGIMYGGQPLDLETRYAWTVQVTDNFGVTHESEPAYFETGTAFDGAGWIMPIKALQNETDPLTEAHKAAGNTYDIPNGDVEAALLEQFGFAPATTGWERTNAQTGDLNTANRNNYARLGGNPLLRTEVPLAEKEVASATLYMTGLGNYEAYVNGVKATLRDPAGDEFDPIMAPGSSDYRLFTNYQAYDVTASVQANPGAVALGAEMTKGYYAGRVASGNFNPSGNFVDTGREWLLPGSTNNSRTMALLGKLIITYADGTQQVVGTNTGDWKSIAGPIVFSDYYMGEIYDANVAQALAGWTDVGYDDSAWYAVTDKGNISVDGELAEVDFATRYAASGSSLEPNNSAVAEYNDAMTMYPVDAYKFRPEDIVRPTEEEFLASIEVRETGNLLTPNAEFFTVNQRGSINKIPVNFANTDGVFAEPITLSYGEVLSVDFGQNASGVVQMDVAGSKDVILKTRHGEMLNDNVARRTNGINVNGGPDAPEFSLYYGAMRGWDGQTSYYKLSDEGRQSWRPKGTYNGYRYAEISVETPGATVTVYGLSSQIITSAHNRTGSIVTNNEMINRMVENGFWGQASNWSTIPTDCNQRTERAGWTGDAQIIANAAMFNFDAIPFYDAYMEMIKANGVNYDNRYGAIMPAGWSTSTFVQTATGWSDSGIVIPWQAYQKSGDTYLIRRNFDSMDGFCDLIYGNGPSGDNGTFSLGGVTVRRLHTYATNQYGDWLAFKGAHLQYVSIVYEIYSTVLMRNMAEAIGNDEAVAKYAARYEELKEYFLSPPVIVETQVANNNRYGFERIDGGFVYDAATAAQATAILNKEDRTNVSALEKQRVAGDLMSSGTRQGSVDDIMDNAQTALVWALKLGLYKDEAHRQQLVDTLYQNLANEGRQIRNEPEYSLGVGFLGVNVLLPVTTDVGGYELAYKAVLQDRVPGWMAPVRNKGTTWWERWNSYDVTFGFGPSGMNSFNHFSYGCVNEWFYEYMLGMKTVATNPGYKEIKLAPMIDTTDYSDVENFELEIEPITNAAGSFDSLYGMIESAWTTDEARAFSTYSFKIPANTYGTLLLPVAASAMEGFENIAGITYKGMTTNNGVEVAEFDVAAGGYDLAVVDGKLTAAHQAGYVLGPSYGVVTAEQTAFGDKVEYVFNARAMEDVNLVEIEFVANGEILDASAFTLEGMGGFTKFRDLELVEQEDGTLAGKFLVGGIENGLLISGDSDIATLTFDSKKLGLADLTVTAVSAYGVDADGDGAPDSVARGVAIDPAKAVTKVYSVYDLNDDGVVDYADLSLAFYYYQAKSGDGNWDAAKVADTDNDGEVDMVDLLAIYANFIA